MAQQAAAFSFSSKDSVEQVTGEKEKVEEPEVEVRPELAGRIEELCQIIDEKEKTVKDKKEELHTMEVEVEVCVECGTL